MTDPMTDPTPTPALSPEDRATIRARYTALMPSARDNAAARRRRLLALGQDARTDVPRLLDALDTAEAEVARLSQAGVEALATLAYVADRMDEFAYDELRSALDDTTSLDDDGHPLTAPAPVWDEDAVTRALDEHRAYPASSPHCACGWRPALSMNDTEADRSQHREHQADALLAVVREHLPTRPDREALSNLLLTFLRPPKYSGGSWTYSPGEAADAVLALWPGRSEAKVKAEALRDAADARFPRYDIDVWLRARADRIEKGADRD